MKSQSGVSHLHASLSVQGGFLRFTSSATPTDLLSASMAADGPFRFHNNL